MTEEGVPAEIMENIAALNKLLDQIKDHVESFLRCSMDDLAEQMEGLDYAKLNTLIAYTLTTLYYGNVECVTIIDYLYFFLPPVYLKSKGISPTEHAVHEEIVRGPF